MSYSITNACVCVLCVCVLCVVCVCLVGQEVCVSASPSGFLVSPGRVSLIRSSRDWWRRPTPEASSSSQARTTSSESVNLTTHTHTQTHTHRPKELANVQEKEDSFRLWKLKLGLPWFLFYWLIFENFRCLLTPLPPPSQPPTTTPLHHRCSAVNYSEFLFWRELCSLWTLHLSSTILRLLRLFDLTFCPLDREGLQK